MYIVFLNVIYFYTFFVKNKGKYNLKIIFLSSTLILYNKNKGNKFHDETLYENLVLRFHFFFFD